MSVAKRIDWDALLFLTVRGATASDLSRTYGCSARTIGRAIAATCPDLYAECVRARPFMQHNHGTVARYQYGCRCPECTGANATDHADRMARARSPIQHGASGYTNRGCRCEICKAAGAEANARYREKIRAGEAGVRHGTNAQASTGCECQPCEWWRERQSEVKHRAWAAERDCAGRWGEQWTGPELEFALARDERGRFLRSATEVAARFGRTSHAVHAIRRRERDPRVGGIA